MFIIGNGFDEAHKLHTLYEDFRKILYERYSIEKMDEMILSVPEVIMRPRGDLGCDKKRWRLSL